MRLLGHLNLLGVLLLAGLCAMQWTTNRRLNLLAIQLDKTRQQQATKIVDQEKSIKGYVADLDDFRDRLKRSDSALRKDVTEIASLTAERERINADLIRTTAERDETRKALTQWMTALKERDDAIKKEGDEVHAAVEKFNDLALKYNGLVKDLDAARAKLAGH